jgi:hypothetical protein
MASTESKERILAAAKELFLARGYAATTVDAICEKAELTKGSVYYFEKAFGFLKHLEKCSPEVWSGGCLLGSFSSLPRQIPECSKPLRTCSSRSPTTSPNNFNPSLSMAGEAGSDSQRPCRYASRHCRGFHHTRQSPP